MRICYLAPAESTHIQKWTERMFQYGHEVHVISLRQGDLPYATLYNLDSSVNRNDSDLRKIAYLLSARRARRIIQQINPDIVHAHYASSYGLLAALSCDRPYYLSVWGEDVYDFPKKSPMHEAAIRFALRRASWLMSTSLAMAEESSKYTDKSFAITPFGVDMDLFNPQKRTRNKDDGRFVVGTVKALEPKYGIDVLLKGVARALDLSPDMPIEVRIAGVGSQLNNLQRLSEKLGIADRVTWLGFIPQEQAAIEWANMDVAIVMSENESESFGVSSVEAQACGTAVVYSDIPGLMEAADNGHQGVLLRRGDHEALANVLRRLYEQPEERREIGQSSRDYVLQTYEIESCFRRIEALYNEERVS